MEEVRVTRRLFTDAPSQISKAMRGLVNSPHAKALSFDRTNYVIRDCSTHRSRACRVMMNVGLVVEPLTKKR